MPVQNSPQRTYILNRDYRLIRTQHELNDLELAVVGYVAWATDSRGNETDRRSSVPYSEVYELIFEYLKKNEPDKIRLLIRKNIEMLRKEQRLYETDCTSSSGGLTDRIEGLISAFGKLAKKRIRDVTYSKFYPEDLKNVREGMNPWYLYANGLTKKLVRRGILSSTRRYEGKWSSYGSLYKYTLQLSPSLKISKAKKGQKQK